MSKSETQAIARTIAAEFAKGCGISTEDIVKAMPKISRAANAHWIEQISEALIEIAE